MVLTHWTIILVTLCVFLYYYFTRTFNYWKQKGVTGPKPIPIFGNLFQSTIRRKGLTVVFKEIYEAFPGEKVVGVYRMMTPCLLIRDLDIIKHIMVKDFNVFCDRGVEYSKEGLGANLFHADEDTWRVLRSWLTPIFTAGKLKNMVYIVRKCADNFVQYFDEMLSEQSDHDVYRLAQKFTTTSICACAFGIELDIRDNSYMVNTLEKIDNAAFNVNFANDLDMMNPGILKKNKNMTYISKFFNNLVQDIVNKRNGVPSDRGDFMDLLLELRQHKELYAKKKSEYDEPRSMELTDDVIAAQAFIFYIGGYESSATTIACMLYELAKNPDMQETLVAEIDQVLNKHKGNVTYETLQDLNYLGKIFDETLRLHPTSSTLQRNAKVDYKIPGMDLTIPKGTTVLVSSFGIQYDEKYYPDPMKFDPERHSPENAKNRHPCAYMAFGIGPRNCIGVRFAKLQSRMFMLKFFSKFRVQMAQSTPAEIQINPWRIISTPRNGIRLDIIKR